MKTASFKSFPSGHSLRNWSLTAGNNPFHKDYCYYWHSVVYSNILLKTWEVVMQPDLGFQGNYSSFVVNGPFLFLSEHTQAELCELLGLISYCISCYVKKYALHQSQHSNQWSKKYNIYC